MLLFQKCFQILLSYNSKEDVCRVTKNLSCKKTFPCFVLWLRVCCLNIWFQVLKQGSIKKRKRRSFANDAEDGIRAKVMNPEKSLTKKLRDNEPFKNIFHPMNLCDMKLPKDRNGNTRCLRWHTMGYCYRDCRYAAGHRSNESARDAGIAEFIKLARVKQAAFEAFRMANTSQDEAPDENRPRPGN